MHATPLSRELRLLASPRNSAAAEMTADLADPEAGLIRNAIPLAMPG